MRLVLVHGMRQEGKDPDILRAAWEKALHDGWGDAGLAVPRYDLDMPFYGDELDRLTCEARGSSQVVARGPDPGGISHDEERLLREYAAAYGIEDAELNAELGAEIVAKGPANWEWVQAIARRLERRVPLFGVIGLDFVRQVEAYLNRPHIQQAVDAIVEPALAGGRAVVVAHSLGTIVTYRLLRKLAGGADVPLLVSLGSPLGIDVVKHRIQPPRPLARPEGVVRWMNGTDERDYVALHARLEAHNFAPDIENLSDIRNSRADPHSIVEYLADRRVVKSIFYALTS